MPQRRPLLRLILCVGSLVAFLQTFSGANAASAATERRQLQIQQHQDALNLHLQQSIRARRYDLDAAHERRLDQLQLRQRLEQQQLEQQQVQRDRMWRHSPGPDSLPRDTDAAAQREIFAQERQLQLQRFELEQRQLLDSAPRQPLQPASPSGQLNLP
jgi:hypothetical protein